MDAPSGGAPEQAPRWDLVDTESYGCGISFLAPYLIVWGYVGIYRRKEYVGGATGGPRGWRARAPTRMEITEIGDTVWKWQAIQIWHRSAINSK